MPSRAGKPNITKQIQREIDYINDHLGNFGDKSAYYAIPLPDAPIQPTILLTKGRVMKPYSFVFVDRNLKATTICPAIHPADLLYRLAEIKHALFRHFPAEGVPND